MSGKGIIHTDATKIRCAYLYASLGNYSQVARDTKIKRTSIMSFAKSSDVFNEALVKARQEISDELLAQNLALAIAANVQVADRIQNGDYKLVQGKDNNGKYHDQVRVPMTGKDLAVVSGIKEDKGRVSMGLATHVTGKDTNANVVSFLEQIAKSFDKQSEQVVAIQHKDKSST